MSDLRYPIGKFEFSGTTTEQERQKLIKAIAETPGRLRAAVQGLFPEQLNTPYRPGGWTVRQVVHHLPDSHLNSYVRFKLALTEDQPTIKPYDEARWAELEEARTGPVEMSLDLLASLHQRWTAMMRSFSAADWQRKFVHPERGVVTLEANLAMYAWHGRHHVAHIAALRERMGW